MPFHGNYYPSLLCVSQFSVTAPTLSTTASGGAHSHYNCLKQEIIASWWVWGGLKRLLADAEIT